MMGFDDVRVIGNIVSSGGKPRKEFGYAGSKFRRAFHILMFIDDRKGSNIATKILEEEESQQEKGS